MKQTLLLTFLFIYTLSEVKAQDIPVRRISGEIFKNVKKDKDTSTWRWKRNGIVGANLAQGSLSNWAAGGDNFSLTANTYFSYYIYHRAKRYTWDNSFDFNFGFVQATSLGSRKNDDRIDLLSKFGYKVDSVNRWYASALFNFRSQLFDGYNYSGSSSNFSSSFLSPAYIILSLGMDYKPNTKFSVFISPLTTRTVLVLNDYLSKQGSYGVPMNKHSFSELGAFVTMTYNNEIAKNISYRGRMDLFSNYGHNPGNIDVFFTNMFLFKINKWLSATYNLDLIYDDDIKIFGPNNDAPRLQMKSLLGIGFLMNLEPVKK
ncbi:MAG: DUF3078 domain-containing protein [Chitinophagales bacterium]|nr:DUF3078 domain-containing protein [Chitinophagales bacterium]